MVLATWSPSGIGSAADGSTDAFVKDSVRSPKFVPARKPCHDHLAQHLEERGVVGIRLPRFRRSLSSKIGVRTQDACNLDPHALPQGSLEQLFWWVE
jgi:hypothetical protein